MDDRDVGPAQGDQDWASPYVNAWGDRLAHFAFTYVLDPDDAQDVVQEAFLRLVRWGRAHPREPASLAWMYTVTRNLAVDVLRRRRREMPTRVAEWVRVAPDLETRVAARSTIDRLPPRDREVLWLFYYEDWSAEDIGRALDMTPNAVRLRLVRARRKLEHLWEGDAADE